MTMSLYKEVQGSGPTVTRVANVSKSDPARFGGRPHEREAKKPTVAATKSPWIRLNLDTNSNLYQPR